MLFNPLRHFSLRVTLSLLPAFALWWFIQSPLLTASAIPLNAFISHQFEREQMSLEAVSAEKWIIHTGILSEKPTAETKPDTWSIQIAVMEVFSIYTLGLPLLWSFLLAVPEKWTNKLKKLLVGTGLIILSIFLIEWLILILKIQELKMAHGESIYVYPGILLSMQIWEEWQFELLKVIISLTGYLCKIILPVLIWYQMNLRFIQTILLIRQL